MADDTTYTREELEALTNDDLHGIADNDGIEVKASATKAELVAAILGEEAPDTGTGPDATIDPKADEKSGLGIEGTQGKDELDKTFGRTVGDPVTRHEAEAHEAAAASDGDTAAQRSAKAADIADQGTPGGE